MSKYEVYKNGRALDDPTFVLRAQDVFSVDALRAYRQACAGRVVQRHLVEVDDIIDAFVAWQVANPRSTRVPSPKIPRS